MSQNIAKLLDKKLLSRLRKTPKKRNIAFDIDGVLNDFNREFVTRMRDHFQLDLPLEPDNYDYWYSDYPELTTKKVNEFFENEVRNGMFLECSPYPEAQIVLDKILDNPNYNVYFITARGTEHTIHWTKELTDRVQNDTKLWLKQYFPKFNQENLIFDRNKDEVLHDLNCELMVEDKFATAEAVSGICKSLLLTRAWNKKFETKGSTRIKSIAEVSFFL